MKPRVKSKPLIWITRDRIQIPVPKMATNHIQNSMNWLLHHGKSGSDKDKWLKVFEKELNNRNIKTIKP